jgi:hypothetical protein
VYVNVLHRFPVGVESERVPFLYGNWPDISHERCMQQCFVSNVNRSSGCAAGIFLGRVTIFISRADVRQVTRASLTESSPESNQQIISVLQTIYLDTVRTLPSGTISYQRSRFEEFTGVTKLWRVLIVFWNMMPCIPVEVCRRFEGITCLRLQGWRVCQTKSEKVTASFLCLLFNPENWGNSFLRNVGGVLPGYRSLHSGREYSSYEEALWDLQFSRRYQDYGLVSCDDEQVCTKVPKQPTASIFRVESFYLDDGGNRLLRNAGVWHTRRSHISQDQSWKKSLEEG